VRIAAVRIVGADRDKVRSGHLAAAILWAIAKANRDSLVIRPRAFDERFGSAAAREAIVAGADPDDVVDRQRDTVAEFWRAAARFRLYQ